MKRFLFTITCLLAATLSITATATATLTTCSTTAPAASNTTDKVGNRKTAAIIRNFDKYCDKTFEEWHIPAMAVVVVKDGKVVYLKGFGTDQDGRPVDPVTSQFVIASASKAFTGTLLGMTVDRYDVNWSDPVIKHLPDFRMNDSYVTEHLSVNEICAHHNGWKAYCLDDIAMFGYERDEIVKLFSAVKPSYEFRTQYAYSNQMYSIAAQIIEKKMGMSWDDALVENIYKPLGMTHSTSGNKSFLSSPNLVWGGHVYYNKETESVDATIVTEEDREEAFTWLGAAAPSAFVMTTASDLSHWLQFHLDHGVFEGDTLISRKNHDFLFKPQTIMSSGDTQNILYAQGWRLTQSSKVKYIHHTGLAYGYTSLVGFVPSLNLGYAFVTANGTTYDPQVGMSLKLMDLCLGIDGPDYAHDSLVEFIEDRKARASAPASAPASATTADSTATSTPAPTPAPKPAPQSLPDEQYCGLYRQEAFGTAEVFLRDGELRFKLKKVDSALTHKKGDVFTFRVPGAGKFDLTFKVEDGIVKALNFDINDPIEDFVKIPNLHTMQDQGIERSYYFYMPEQLEAHRPLLFILHGYGGSAAKTRQKTIQDALDAGFAVCVPQGAPDPAGRASWNVGYPSQKGWEQDDVEFLCTLGRKLQQEYSLSERNTFVCGMSNGGEMCYLLASVRPDYFAAFAPIAGLTMQWMADSLAINTPVNLMEVHGTEDRVSEWKGDPTNAGGWGEYMAVPEAVRRWSDAAGCTREVIEKFNEQVLLHRYLPPTTAKATARTTAKSTAKSSAKTEKSTLTSAPTKTVLLYEVVGGNHSWSLDQMDTVGEMLRFFKDCFND